MLDKLKKFFVNKRINSLFTVWLFIKQIFFYKWRFKEFGKKSILVSPIRLLGTKHIQIGGGVNILNHARIEAIEEYGTQKFIPQLIIGNKTNIGQNFHCICANQLNIGENVTISANVFISDVNHSYKRKMIHVLEQELEVKKTSIGDYSFIGYGAVILPGAIIGKQCIVGANSVVLAGKYPDYSVLAGIPSKIVKTEFG